ncbi:MAG: tRNA lysidine(34) synthetase TilS [Bacteroidetes bacterium]|nr:tRNA lysidine(34) synthetase TilS [Bacteroidota bacterium]
MMLRDPGHLEARVVEFLRTRGLLVPGTEKHPGTHLLVAASGGRDSTVLAYIASSIARKWHVRLTLATVHHGLREEADHEVAFVHSLAREFEAGFLQSRVDVRGEMLRSGASLQDAARRLRYAALEQMRAESAADIVLTAHHAHDQAETLLAHFLRGAGPDGLAGIRPVRERVARPLLEIPADSIAAYAAANAIEWLEDPSNATDDYRRNAIRHHVSPAVSSVFGPGWVAALGESARLYGMLAGFLQEMELSWNAAVEFDGEAVVVREMSLNASSEFEKLIVCRLALRQTGVSMPSLRDAFLLHDLLSGTPGSVRQLSRGIRALRTGDGLRLLPATPQPEDTEAAPGCRIRWGKWTFTAEELPSPNATDATTEDATAKDVGPRHPSLPVDDPFEEIVDLDAVGASWRLRTWIPTDRFEPFGFGREKNVGMFLSDRGVTLPQRQRIPVLEGPCGIIWVCGVRLAQHAALHAGSTRFCRLRYSTNDRDTV